MKDICCCGHGRNDHEARYGACLRCTHSKTENPSRPFACRPGTCDRFTWDPEREPKRRVASREEQHGRYLDCGPAAWDDR